MKRAVIIVAGGSGRRLGGTVPKQYLNLGGKPMIRHSIETFLSFDPEMTVVVVIAKGHEKYWNSTVRGLEEAEGFLMTFGGHSRFESVVNGLNLVENDMIVGIHDAARPFVSLETLERCYETAFHQGSAIPVVKMDESMRILTGGTDSDPLDREGVKKVQTPQVFRSEEIKAAYGQAGRSGYTDDASVFETRFGKVCLVEGNRENIKITTSFDMKLARALMEPGD